MTTKSHDLAAQLDTRAHDAVALLRQVSDTDWKKMAEAEKWSVGVTAHHLAGALEAVAGLVTAIVAGRAPGRLTTAMLDKLNAAHAIEHDGCTKAETIALFERGAGAASVVVRGLGDGDLERTAPCSPTRRR